MWLGHVLCKGYRLIRQSVHTSSQGPLPTHRTNRYTRPNVQPATDRHLVRRSSISGNTKYDNKVTRLVFSYCTVCVRNFTEQQQDARFSAVFEIQMHYGDATASLITWSRTLWLLFISKSKIGSERAPFWVNRRHPEGWNAGHKRHPPSCFPGMLKTMAALLEKVCAGTRDALWSDHIVDDE